MGCKVGISEAIAAIDSRTGIIAFFVDSMVDGDCYIFVFEDDLWQSYTYTGLGPVGSWGWDGDYLASHVVADIRFIEDRMNQGEADRVTVVNSHEEAIEWFEEQRRSNAL